MIALSPIVFLWLSSQNLSVEDRRIGLKKREGRIKTMKGNEWKMENPFGLSKVPSSRLYFLNYLSPNPLSLSFPKGILGVDWGLRVLWTLRVLPGNRMVVAGC